MIGNRVAAACHAIEMRKAHGYKVGKLDYCKKGKCNSFTYNQSGFQIYGGKLFLSKIGAMKIVLHRQLVNIKQVTIVRQAGNWYAVITCKIVKPICKFIDPRRSVGIDVGIAKFAHDSNNHEVANSLFMTKALRPLKRAQRKVSRRNKDSHNREKAKSWVARLHERIASKRRDFLHKISTEYARKYDIIFLERLRISNMMKNHHLARHIQDSGWGTFKTMLGYKAKIVVAVEPAYTSIDCSRCGNPVPKELAVRTHRCDKCGLVIDRDHNASLNILQRGLSSYLSLLPVERREVTPVEIAPLPVSVEDRQVRSLKQETYAFKRGSSLVATL